MGRGSKKQVSYKAGRGTDVGTGTHKNSTSTRLGVGLMWVGDPYKQHIYTAGCGPDVDTGETIILTIDGLMFKTRAP